MPAAFSIEKPTVVATLPRPTDHYNGRYVVSEVYGGTPGSKKRKRSELVVGIDGEGLNIYDTQSSRLITSYALPPQSFFTCSPCSVRLKSLGKNGFERRTYVSSQSTTSNLTLFRDMTTPDGTTESKVEKKILQNGSSPITFLNTISEQGSEGRDNLLLIRKDGEIQCLDGIDLGLKWTSPPSAISKNTSLLDTVDHEVQFAQITNAHIASKRLLRDHEHIRSVFAQEIEDNGFNPDILVIITRPKDHALASDRTLHVVTLPLKTASHSNRKIRSVHTLLSVALPKFDSETIDKVEYNLNTSSGILHELGNGYLRSVDLSGSRPKLQTQLYVKDATSFLPLSRTSILTATERLINIYNRTFQSIQASTSLKSNLENNSRKRKIDDDDALLSTPKSCSLLTYSSKHNMAYAIAGNDLLAFQIDSRQDVLGRSRGFDRLIDTLGCGVTPATKPLHGPLGKIPLKSLGFYIPGSDSNLVEVLNHKLSELDRLILHEDVEGFEKLMANELGIEIEAEQPDGLREEQQSVVTNGVSTLSNDLNGLSAESYTKSTAKEKNLPQWVWPEFRSDYPAVDPRLVQYALSRIFSWRSDTSERPEDTGTSEEVKLVIAFLPPNVFQWLIETGNLSTASINSALRRDGQISTTERVPGGKIVTALADVDPEMKYMFSFISNSHLDAIEILQAIRLLMQSLGLLEDTPEVEYQRLTNGEIVEPTNGELEAKIELEEEKAATALSLAESYLGDYSNIRARALSVALAKLHARPASDVVSAFRSMLTSAEIVALVYLLRFELARGAWTSRYLDNYEGSGTGDEQGQENTILLVSGLLNCCIDAIGAGGWLSGDSILLSGDHLESEELIQSLKLEVSAALEGIEEASYLRGLVADMVRYGEAVQKGLRSNAKGSRMEDAGVRESRPITMPQLGRDSRLLPFGLKSEQQVSLYRVGAGGEIQPRTARDIGRLKSRKVGKYSRERIVI